MASDLTRDWSRTFDGTVVVTIPGREDSVERLLASVPFDRRLVTLDVANRDIDCARNRPEANHHVVVGERHRRIVRRAAEAGWRNVCVLEDDAEFVPWLRTDRAAGAALERALAWIRLNPGTWDVFYLGYLAPWLTGCRPVGAAVVEPARPMFAHGLAYNHSVYAAILALDLRADHRPRLHRWVERLAGTRDAADAYFRDGVGSIDTWLSFAPIRRLAVHPMAVIQHELPPGTRENWTRRTGRPYDTYRTPARQAGIAVAWHYTVRSAVVVAAWCLT